MEMVLVLTIDSITEGIPQHGTLLNKFDISIHCG
jgi:hypothetical protein